MAEPLLGIIQIQHAQEILIEIDLEDASGGIMAKTKYKHPLTVMQLSTPKPCVRVSNQGTSGLNWIPSFFEIIMLPIYNRRYELNQQLMLVALLMG